MDSNDSYLLCNSPFRLQLGDSVKKAGALEITLCNFEGLKMTSGACGAGWRWTKVLSASPKGWRWALSATLWLGTGQALGAERGLSLIHISEPTRHSIISYAVFCLKTVSYTHLTLPTMLMV